MNRTMLTLLAGIAIGILLAPRKGSETWDKIMDSFDDLKDKANDLKNKASDKAGDLYDRAAGDY